MDDGFPPLPAGMAFGQFGGQCPVQGDIEWDGHGPEECYFRARHESWSLGGNGFSFSGSYGVASWMGRRHAMELAAIHMWAAAWISGELPKPEGADGELLSALLAMDPKAVAAALAAGARAGEPLGGGAPTPLCFALAFCPSSNPAGFDPASVKFLPGEAQGYSMRDWTGCSLADPWASERLEVCQALAGAGASLDDAAPGWRLRPAAWGCALPCMQASQSVSDMRTYWDGGGHEAELDAINARLDEAAAKGAASSIALWLVRSGALFEMEGDHSALALVLGANAPELVMELGRALGSGPFWDQAFDLLAHKASCDAGFGEGFDLEMGMSGKAFRLASAIAIEGLADPACPRRSDGARADVRKILAALEALKERAVLEAGSCEGAPSARRPGI